MCFFSSLPGYLFFFLCASIWMTPLTHIITLSCGLRKVQQDTDFIPLLCNCVTVCPSSFLLSHQSHSTICKSSRPQWNRVTTEEKHKVNMANTSCTSSIWLVDVVIYSEHSLFKCISGPCAFICPFSFMFSCFCDTLLPPQWGQRSGWTREQLVGILVLVKDTSAGCRCVPHSEKTLFC